MRLVCQSSKNISIACFALCTERTLSKRIIALVLALIVWLALSAALFETEHQFNKGISSFPDAVVIGGLIAFADSTWSNATLVTGAGRAIGTLLILYRNLFYMFLGILLAPAAEDRLGKLRKKARLWLVKQPLEETPQQ